MQLSILLPRTLVVIGCCLLSLKAIAEERRFSLLEREIEYLMEIWPGDYDNREQVQFDNNAGKTTVEDGAHARVHSRVSRVHLPKFSEYLLYVEEYRNNDPANLTRQQLYELIADEASSAVRVRRHNFRDGTKWQGSLNESVALRGLTRKDTTSQEECDLLLRRDVDALRGATSSRTCKTATEDKSRSIDHEVRITEQGYWFREREVAADGDKALKDSRDYSWTQLERARWFQCMVDFPREDGGRPVNTVGYVRIHDQGGAHSFTFRDGREMVLTLRNNWSYGMQRETLVVVVQEGDESGPTLVYGWTEPGADRIGVNPGWIRLQCDLDTAKMRKFQQWLRPDS